MSDTPFVAEIIMFAGNFAPVGWATCDGQILPISQNTALFSLLGTFYGGNGTSNFALPDLRGRVPLEFGQGPGLSDYFLGQQGGADSVTLLTSEMPAHSHVLQAASSLGTSDAPVGMRLARSDAAMYRGSASAGTPVSFVAPTGGSQAHQNLMPYLTLTFCIALQGVFPARS